MTIMSELCLHLHFLLLLLLSCVSPSSLFTFDNHVAGLLACHPHQIQALTQFENEFDSSSCNQTDFFNGVQCNNMTGAITKLRLPSGCLSGTLKPNSSLFGLHQLRYLDLSDNQFTSSSLPSEFGKLNKLEVLSLSSNGFIGTIPSSLSSLSLLSVLDLSGNELTGSFPVFHNLSKLTFLNLAHNHLSGTLNPNSSLFELHHLHFLDLSNNNFISSLPYEFGNLNKLEAFSLSSNGFFGQVPPTISNLTSLTELYLHTNDFTGSFPLVQNLTKLFFVEISTNKFFGTIPPSLFTMPHLSHLYLRQNHFSGHIEVSNSSFSYKLEHLWLGSNHFEGQVLEIFPKLTKLKELDLSFLNINYPIDLNLFSSLKYLLHLELSGNNIFQASLSSDSHILLTLENLVLIQCGIKEFPNILKTLQNLVIIDMSHNIISGIIPKWFWTLPHLSSVFISNNSFVGFEGPTDVLVNSSVRMLTLESNNLEGALPHLPLSINLFAANDNKFRGDIPLSICNISRLGYLSLSYNNFTGLVPPCLSNLMVLDLRKNNLEGSIPDNFYVDAPLQTLDVGYNRFTGKLPRSLINCSSLQFLVIENNGSKDTFPFWLRALPNLQVLVLHSNKFYGPISPPNGGPLGFPELRIFEISDNSFTGSLPPNYFVDWKASSPMNGDGNLYMEYHTVDGESERTYIYINYIDLHYKGLSMEQAKVLTSYATIDLSGNKLEGQIPESIGCLKALIALNLSSNAFTGHIPLSFSNLTEIESVDLSRNQLSGTIPNGIGSLSFLEYIDVSHNQLKGEIPQGPQITGQSKSSFEGNAGLCGLPLEETCFRTNAPPKQTPKEEEEDGGEVLNWKVVAIIYGPGVLLGLAIAQLIALYKPEWLIMIIGPNKRRNR